MYIKNDFLSLLINAIRPCFQIPLHPSLPLPPPSPSPSSFPLHLPLFSSPLHPFEISSMFLYNLTVSPATSINAVIIGNFSGSKQQEILLARNSTLELIKPDPNTGLLHTLLTHPVFGIVRSLAPFRLTGASKGESNPPYLFQFPPT